MPQASVIVVGNEKGGAGKSTLAIHIATALLHGGAKVAVLDLDLRQQTMGHFFANRARLAGGQRRRARPCRWSTAELDRRRAAPRPADAEQLAASRPPSPRPAARPTSC